jgi:hypothetical protein
MLKQFSHPGTHIVTDGWSAYTGIRSLGIYTHEMIGHQGFNIITGVNKDQVDDCRRWNVAKLAAEDFIKRHKKRAFDEFIRLVQLNDGLDYVLERPQLFPEL